jgi:altronate dehydratase
VVSSSAGAADPRPNPFAFDQVARIPAPRDNVAIATRRLEAGTRVSHGDVRLHLPHVVLEGHRFVLEPIAAGEPLLSWGLPFGIATRDLVPGEYVCNDKILAVLAERDIDFDLPKEANFRDHLETYHLDTDAFRPGTQVAKLSTPATFMGYPRAGARGVGTRNFVVILATTSGAAAFAETLAARFTDQVAGLANVDGVVAVTHTEGGGRKAPNNLDFVLRTLAGFMVHANVGAVMAADYGDGCYSNDTLRRFMTANGYPLEHVRHEFLDLDSDRHATLERAAGIVADWLPVVNACERRAESVANLKVALQCGGSDAFSGISGNALAGCVAKEIIRNGGSANLAETDELIGAEPYVLDNVRDEATARAFLDKIAVFKQRAANHGASAEGNPSGGNNYRGLYNIALKSIGAARKRDPEVRLDYVIDYGAPMTDAGYYFMDSPGNDLESIAGQVASGSNLVFFITGNGSITNFPFVPTLKFVTTTGRFDLLADEMDVNAGRYNDGEPMTALAEEVFARTREVASGDPSKGELAGHSQVSLWRNWQQTDGAGVERIRQLPVPDGEPLSLASGEPAAIRFQAYRTDSGHSCDQLGLIMPTSLCSGQVARLVADDLNARDLPGVSRFVALAHTEGCGSANSEGLFLQTLLGHVEHPLVRRGMLLEHGCEKTHNDAVRHYLDSRGVDPSRFGYASVQLDGGLEKVRRKIAAWFEEELGRAAELETEVVDGRALRLGLVTAGHVPETMARVLASVVQGIVSGGGTVVVADNGTLLDARPFRDILAEGCRRRVTLAYGQPADRPGLHVMDAPTESPVEITTGLGGTGVEIMLAHVHSGPLQSHPMVPLLQMSSSEECCRRFAIDLDLIPSGPATVESLGAVILEKIAATASRRYVPKLQAMGHGQFQLTRGLLGLSM